MMGSLPRRSGMKTLPFDPADYLDTEEGIAAYLADARAFGPEAVADAVEVVARARARMAGDAGAPARSVAEPGLSRFSRD